MTRVVSIAILSAALAVLAGLSGRPAHAAPGVSFGIQDDAWILYGAGPLGKRLDTLDRLGVDIVRYTLRWDEVEPARGRFRWKFHDPVLRGLRTRGIQPVVTLVGVPAWANGGRPPRFAPSRGREFAAFARAAARRYPFVRRWVIWNEPNLRRWLEPNLPGVYVRRLLNPAYAAIHRVNRRALVAGGVTGPRGNVGGVSPLLWLRGMKIAGAKLDAYAHHPHPGSPVETPTNGGCIGPTCETITMANLDLLLREVRRNFGARARVWLTEWGYQTNPPDHILGVSETLQSRYLGEAAVRVHRAPRVDMLIHYLYKDEPQPERFQSGLVTVTGTAKQSLRAFPFPLAQLRRSGATVRFWGQVRPRTGRQPYRIQLIRGSRRTWLTPVRRTNRQGVFEVSVRAPAGALVRIWSPRDRRYGDSLVAR